MKDNFYSSLKCYCGVVQCFPTTGTGPLEHSRTSSGPLLRVNLTAIRTYFKDILQKKSEAEGVAFFFVLQVGGGFTEGPTVGNH